MTLDRNLKAAQVAAALGVSVDSIGRYARAGQIPFAATPGGHRLFNLAEVRQALAPSGRTPTRDVFDAPVSTRGRRQRRAVVSAAAGAAPQPARRRAPSGQAPSGQAPSAAVADLVTPARRVLHARAAG